MCLPAPLTPKVKVRHSAGEGHKETQRKKRYIFFFVPIAKTQSFIEELVFKGHWVPMLESPKSGDFGLHSSRWAAGLLHSPKKTLARNDTPIY
jgi:hypothetical protein